MKTQTQFTKRDIGIVIDCGSDSADSLNRQTIDLAKEHGFEFDGLFDGYFEGLRGLYIRMSLDDAESASHQGECDDDVRHLALDASICDQLDAIGPDNLRDAMRETGAWDADELSDDAQNRLRAIWLAACDIRENSSQTLSELADDAVNFLNELELPSYCSFYFEDNSLFLAPCIENVKEDVGFVSSRDQIAPDDDYEGEWLEVNDHGNCTLYLRDEKGNDTEIWSFV